MCGLNYLKMDMYLKIQMDLLLKHLGKISRRFVGKQSRRMGRGEEHGGPVLLILLLGAPLLLFLLKFPECLLEFFCYLSPPVK